MHFMLTCTHPGATERAAMDVHGQRALRALHTDTHATPAGCCEDPSGDAYADVAFGYFMARLLKHFETQLQGTGVLSTIPSHTGPALFGRPVQQEGVPTTFIGPVWMDDLAVCLWGEDCHSLTQNVGLGTSLLLDAFREHAMSPNLSKV